MKKLSDLIINQLNSHGVGDSARASEVLYHANLILEEIFPDSKNNIKIHKFSDNTLYLGVINAVWSQEVWFNQGAILSRLDLLFKNKVKKISIKHLTSY